MRLFIVACVVVGASATAFADKPSPPWLRIQPETEIELTPAHRLEISVGVAPHDATDAEIQSSCSLTQGNHHVESSTPGDSDCTVSMPADSGFVAGPATLQARINIGGVWSDPSAVQIKLDAPGNLWTNFGGTQGTIVMSYTRSATLVKDKLSFIVFTQNDNAKAPEPNNPFLGRLTITIPPNGKIDQLVPIEARWLEPLEKSEAWKQLLGKEATLLLEAKALRIKGTYSAKAGAELDIIVPGWTRVPSSVVFRPASYKQQINDIDCDKLSPAERRVHSICNL
jgi:hypothetical protein